MGQKKSTKHKWRFVLLNTVSQCAAQSLSKSIPCSRAASFPVFLLPFVSVWNSMLQLHTFRSFGVDKWKNIHPISAAQLLGLYSWGKKKNQKTNRTKQTTIRYSCSTKDKATLLFKQSFFLPFHTHNPLSRITVASMCTWEVFPLYHSSSPLFPCSSAPPRTGFALIFPAFVHVHCFTPPHLFNVLLKKSADQSLLLPIK